MTGWRTALRVARREALRAKGRSVLVVAMIMIPLAALAFLAVGYDTFRPTPTERADRMMGAAQAVVSWPLDGPIEQDPQYLQAIPAGGNGADQRVDPAVPADERLLALLPAGSKVIREQLTSLTMRTATGVGALSGRLLDYADPLARGIYRQLTGRVPAGADEVALTPAAVTRLGTGVGGTIGLADGSRTFRVVGTVEDPLNLQATTIVLRSGALPANPQDNRADTHWLVGLPGDLTWAQVKDLNTHGVAAVSRYVLANPPGAAEKYPHIRMGDAEALPGTFTLLGGLAMLEVVLLAGPAFAVSVRRRRRDLALVAATGGTPGQVRGIVLADGVVLGAVAAVAGAALGIGAAAVTRPLLEDFLNYRSGAFRVYPVAQLILVVLAVVTGVLAALVPAWISSRQDVVSALAGRRGITRSRRRWLILGLVLVAAGVGGGALGASNLDLTTVLLGLILFELGLVLCTPALVGLVARVGRLLPVAPRIALRDTSRNRTAAAPAISAVMAAVVGSIAIAVVITSEYQRSEDAYTGRPGDVVVYGMDPRAGRTTSAETVSAVRATMPVDQVHEIDALTCDSGRACAPRAVIPDALDCPYWPRKLGGRLPTADEQRAARHDSRCDRLGNEYLYFGIYGTTFGLVVVIDPDAAGAVANLSAEDAAAAAAALRAGSVVVDEPRYLQNGRVTLALDPIAGEVGTGPSVTAPGFALPHVPKAPIVMLTKETATALGLRYEPFVTLASTTRMPTVAEQDRLQAMLGSQLRVEVARAGEAFDQQLLILAIVAGLIALVAAALATGLAAADGRADLATLAAVGAAPRLRRMLSLSQSGVIAGLGSLLGSVAGLGASTAVLYALNQRFADTWPAHFPYPITVPWFNLAIALLVVPAVAMLGAGLLTRSRLPIERRR